MTEPDRTPPSKLKLAGLGMELVGAIIGGSLLGYWVDYKFGTRYGLLIGSLVGVVGGLYNLIKQALSITHEQQSRHGQSHESRDNDV